MTMLIIESKKFIVPVFWGDIKIGLWIKSAKVFIPIEINYKK